MIPEPTSALRLEEFKAGDLAPDAPIFPVSYFLCSP